MPAPDSPDGNPCETKTSCMENKKTDKSQAFSVADIVKRAKLVMGFKKDVELARYLGISRSTLSNWVARGSIDFPLLLGCKRTSATASWPAGRWNACTNRRARRRWTNAA